MAVSQKNIASRKKSHKRRLDVFEDKNKSEETDRNIYWKAAEERFRVSQKQAAWVENEVNDPIPSTSRGISNMESKDDVKESSGVTVSEKSKRKKLKKKGRIQEIEPSTRKKETGRKDIFFLKTLNGKEELTLGTEVTVPSVVHLASGEEDSATASPAIQRQPLSWSPSPIRPQRHSLPPLPETAEELIQKNLKKLKASSGISDVSKDGNKMGEFSGQRRKKKKGKKISSAIFESERVSKDEGTIFEMKDFGPKETLSRKKITKVSDQASPLEEEEYFCKGAQSEELDISPELTRHDKKFTERQSLKYQQDLAEETSVSSGVDDNTYSISPIREENSPPPPRRGSSAKLITMEQLGLTETYSATGWEISFTPDLFWSRMEALEIEKEKYFYPASSRAPIKERQPPDWSEPSFQTGDELLSNLPMMSTVNLARLENRLLAEGGRNWFQEDGELLSLPNPGISYQCVRFPDPSSCDLPIGLLTESKPALYWEFGQSYEESLCTDLERGDGMRRSKRGCLLEVELLSVEFRHHPLFSKEHVLAQRLLSLWTEYEAHRKSGREKYLADKVKKLRTEKQALVNALTRLQGGQSGLDCSSEENQGNKNTLNTNDDLDGSNLNGLKEQLHWKLKELQKTRTERDTEGKAGRKVLEGILFAWRDLKLLREEQGYSVTPFSLHLQVEGNYKKRYRKLSNGYSSEEQSRAINVEEKDDFGIKKTKRKGSKEDRIENGEECMVEFKSEQGSYDEERAIKSVSERKGRRKKTIGKIDRIKVDDSSAEYEEDYSGKDEKNEGKGRQKEGYVNKAFDESNEIDLDGGGDGGYVKEAFDESNKIGLKGSGDEKKQKMSRREKRREKLKAFYLAELEAAMEMSLVAETSEDTERPVPAPRKRNPRQNDERISYEDLLAEEWRKWNKELEEEVEERVEEAEAMWELDMEELRITQQELDAVAKEAKKKKKKGKRRKGEPFMEECMQDYRPCSVDRVAIKVEVEKAMKESRRPPGEPPLTLKLLSNSADASNISCSREKERKFAVELTEIQARILYNGEEACCSKAVPLTQSFTPALCQAFAIRGLGPPQSLAIELYERVRGHSAIGTAPGGWYPLALVHLPIPTRKKVIKKEEIPEWIEFGSNKVVAPIHSSVGSGIFFNPFPESHDEEEHSNLCLYLSGGFWCRLGWGVSQDGIVLSPRGHHYTIDGVENDNTEELKVMRELLIRLLQGSIGRKAEIGANWERLRNWARDADRELFQIFEEQMMGRMNRATYFCLDSLAEKFTFRKTDQRNLIAQAEEEEWWMSSRRLRVLHLRDRGVPEFRGLRCVPLSDREIPIDIFNTYENRLSSQLTYDFCVWEDGDLMSKSPRGWKGESGGCDPHEGRREWGRRCLQEARFRLLRHSHSAKRLKLSDLVIEEQVPSVGSLGMTLLEWLRPKRPLRPNRQGFTFAHSTASTNPSGSKEVKVKVNVVRAFGVPVRRDIDPVLESSTWNSLASSTLPWEQRHIGDHNLSEVPVQPFVEVVLGTARARTTTALGVNPTWNQELTLSLNLETSIMERTKEQRSLSFFGKLDDTAEDLDMSTWWTSNGDINSVEDLCLTILLKDETTIDLLEDSRARESGEVHQRTQHHFLASLRIPLTILRFNHRLEGTFRLSSPPVLLGYTTEETNFGSGLISGTNHLALGSGLQPGAIYLTLFITVQPPLPALHANSEDERALESIELPHVESHLRAWEMNVFQAMNRCCCPPKALVPDLGGRTVCATRFFRPLAPPPLLLKKWKRGNGVVAADWLARFVSMIPLSTGHQLTDIWLNSEQMLKLLCGSRVDHCILLVCLFMHLGLEVWLAQGSGLPDGSNCTFVLTRGKGQSIRERAAEENEDDGRSASDPKSKSPEKRWRGKKIEEEDFEEDNDWWVWDPITGQRFLSKDPFCPLQHLCCLISDQNIWANIQETDQPQHMNFELENSSDWWSAFSNAPPSNGIFATICSFFPSFFSNLDLGKIKDIQLPVVGSVQPEELPYEMKTLARSSRRKSRSKEDRTPKACSDFYLKLLEEKLENHLQSCIMHWRKNYVTIWNPHASTLLRKLLPQLEHPLVGSPNYSVDESHLLELRSLMSSYKICGFPINVPYDGIGSAREAVRTTGIYNITEPGVEFALAVYLHPYCTLQGESSSILSLWIYVISLVSRSFLLD